MWCTNYIDEWVTKFDPPPCSQGWDQLNSLTIGSPLMNLPDQGPKIAVQAVKNVKNPSEISSFIQLISKNVFRGNLVLPHA